MPREPFPEQELRAAYARTGWARQGISFDRAMSSPDTLSMLSLLATVNRRNAERRNRRPAPLFISHIERSAGDQAELFADQEQ